MNHSMILQNNNYIYENQSLLFLLEKLKLNK